MSKKKSKTDGKANGRDGTATITGDAEASSNGQGPGLDTRRDEMQARVNAAEAAELGVARLENELENNTLAIRQQEAAMEAATARVADLEKALKNSAKERKQLRSARKDARAEAERAREQAVAAEAKYEKSILKQVVRREKAVDLTVHSN